jgi:hypothetical protein
MAVQQQFIVWNLLGALTAGRPSDATENAVLQNVQAAGYGDRPQRWTRRTPPPWDEYYNRWRLRRLGDGFRGLMPSPQHPQKHADARHNTEEPKPPSLRRQQRRRRCRPQRRPPRSLRQPPDPGLATCRRADISRRLLGSNQGRMTCLPGQSSGLVSKYSSATSEVRGEPSSRQWQYATTARSPACTSCRRSIPTTYIGFSPTGVVNSPPIHDPRPARDFPSHSLR